MRYFFVGSRGRIRSLEKGTPSVFHFRLFMVLSDCKNSFVSWLLYNQSRFNRTTKAKIKTLIKNQGLYFAPHQERV
jgi:hypothetical protein